MLETPVRNHPTVLVGRILTLLFITAIVFPTYLTEGVSYLMGYFLGLMVFCAVILVIFWARTTVCATETELISEFDFIMHKRKTVPYYKLASVNVVRTLSNRIFGTATIQVNINSAINAARPEISLCLKNDLANKVRDELSSRIYGLNYSSEQEHVYESSVTLTNRDAILHGIFGNNSWLFIGTILSLVLTSLSLIFLTGDDAIGFVITWVCAAISFIIPAIALVLRYYNFRVYRIGDTIYLQHGAIQLYKTSFKVNKINSVRIKRTFFARLMGKACLEVDVVGINAAKDTTPVLCILTSMENIEKLMKEVVPDFIYEREGEKQPGCAAVPWLLKAFWASCVTAIVYAFPVWFLLFGDVSVLGLNDTALLFLRLSTIGSFGLLVMIYFAAAHVGFNKNRLDIGEDMFMFETGIVDRSRTIMQYDRAQIVTISAWPSARRRGLARCKVYMLSSSGNSRAKSGYYPVEVLERIDDEVLERIRDGRYDYRKTIL